jgi:bisphosphoglycerate-independent phosphoglycerate mutase (AlkP superfamily)
MLGFPEAPVLTPSAAGRKLAELSQQYDFSLFEYWSTDYAGHKQDMTWAVQQLEMFDGVLGGLVKSWGNAKGLILITSDHGNMEDLSTRRHTDARVPAILVGSASARKHFASNLVDLTGIAPDIYTLLTGAESIPPPVENAAR